MGLADFHHIEFSVSNAKQSAYWLCCSFGFRCFSKKENDQVLSLAVKNGDAVFVFTSRKRFSVDEKEHYILHGDTVINVAFRVDNLKSLLENLVTQNIHVISSNNNVISDVEGFKMATIRSAECDLFHTLIEKSVETVRFLPDFEDYDDFLIGNILDPIPVLRIDHAVQSYPENSVESSAEWYKKTLDLNRFWSADDRISTAQATAVQAWLLTNANRKAQYIVAETRKGMPGRSQVQEFVDYNGGSGINHIALLVENIVDVVIAMRKRSVEFLNIPNAYYDILQERLAASSLDFCGDLELLKANQILMDFDDNGYLFQIFTKPLQDRPTVFFELIQRQNFDGFGANNFKTLFEAVEREQKLRGTL